MHAQQSAADRVAEIQTALRDAKLGGWLFYDFRHSDPLAYRILKLDENMLASRRWFYYVPASGEPVKIVQSIEQFKLDSLPGKNVIFRGWQELHARLREVLGRVAKGSKRHVAMQYSPMVNGGTVQGFLALIYARNGDADHAIQLVERLLTTPFAVDYCDDSITLSDLRQRWEWDPLRKDPRFQKILASPEPKTLFQ